MHRLDASLSEGGIAIVNTSISLFEYALSLSLSVCRVMHPQPAASTRRPDILIFYFRVALVLLDTDQGSLTWLQVVRRV